MGKLEACATGRWSRRCEQGGEFCAAASGACNATTDERSCGDRRAGLWGGASAPRDGLPPVACRAEARHDTRKGCPTASRGARPRGLRRYPCSGGVCRQGCRAWASWKLALRGDGRGDANRVENSARRLAAPAMPLQTSGVAEIGARGCGAALRRRATGYRRSHAGRKPGMTARKGCPTASRGARPRGLRRHACCGGVCRQGCRAWASWKLALRGDGRRRCEQGGEFRAAAMPLQWSPQWEASCRQRSISAT